MGHGEQIVEALLADPVVAEATELQINLPYEFSAEDYVQILTDFANRIAPELGWLTQVTAPAVEVTA